MASTPPNVPLRVPGWRQVLAVGCLLLACSCARAAVRMQADSLTLPGVSLAEVNLVAQLGPDGRPRLQLQAAKVSVPALGWRDVALTLAGEPQRASGKAWKFVGHVTTHDAPGGALANADVTLLYDPDGGTLEVDVTQGKSHLEALMPLDQTSHVQMQLAALPLKWLRGLLAATWPGGRLSGGTLAGDVALDLASGDTRVSGRVTASGIDLDSRAGTIAAQKLGAEGSFRIEQGSKSTSMMFDGQLRGGQMLFGPVYAQLPSHPTNLHVAGTLGAGGIRIDSLDYDDPDALRVAGSLGFDRKGVLDKLDLIRFAATFPAAYTRYGTALVDNLTGLKQLETSGSVVGSMRMDGKGLEAFDFNLENVAANGAGIAVAGLDGRLDWRAHASRPATTLAWSALAMDRLALGPARLGLEDRGGALTLRAPVTLALFGGNLQLASFAWAPGGGSSRQQLSAAFSLTDVDLPALCKAFGWPAFKGKLGGAVPDLSYRNGNLAFAGGLSLHVFDGSVSVTNLDIQHPFGASPAMTANIDLQQLDLAELTGVFDFGQITGRLNGSIHGLKMVDWKPVAFAASLATDGGGTISQDAIKSLTQVGGGGIAGGLQGMALRLFKTFGYSKIGLSCTLANGVCTMGGIEPDPDPDDHGYTIVAGSGLPHITVIGHERSVDWATLLSRLKSATHGKGPVIK